MRVLDLFSGIGGFALGLESCGMETVAFVERDPFAAGVLRHHWPHTRIYSDVRHVTARRLAADGIPPPDLICGGFPCQPFSVAGKRKGTDDDRHLWPEFARIIGECRPRWVIAENVPGIRTIAADGVLADMDALGYACWPCVVGAGSAGAPHLRKRAWFLGADLDRARLAQRQPGDAGGARPIGGADPFGMGWWDAEPSLVRVVHGVPHRMDQLRALGNAVVPAVVAAIGRAILRVESELTP